MLNTIIFLNYLQEFLGSILLFFFGAAIGSFVMVVNNRLRIKSFLNSRSVCMSCNKTLYWQELIPIISFILQRGKCKECKSKISMELFFVELLSGTIFAILPFAISRYTTDIFFQSGIFVLFVFSFVFALFIALYDIKHKIINLESLFFLSIISIISQASIQYFDNNIGINYYYLASPIFISAIFIILFIISRGRWIGMGDILLFVVFGLMLPLPISISGMFLSVWIGAAVSLLLYGFYSHKYKMQTQIPFAPFIILGFLIAFIFKVDILNISVFF